MQEGCLQHRRVGAASSQRRFAALLMSNTDNAAACVSLERLELSRQERGLFPPLQPSRHKGASAAKKSFFPSLEDEGIFALIPKQTRLMPLNTRWHY